MLSGLVVSAFLILNANAQTPGKLGVAETTQKANSLTLTDLEQMALQGNPTLGQAATQVNAAKGRTLQSGLYPNPTVGYNGEQIGLRGSAAPGEQQGIFVDQTMSPPASCGSTGKNTARKSSRRNCKPQPSNIAWSTAFAFDCINSWR